MTIFDAIGIRQSILTAYRQVIRLAYGVLSSPYLHVLCQPLEDSLQRKEDIIKVLNGPIFVTINTKLLQLQIVLLYKNLFMKFTSDIYIKQIGIYG